MSFGFRSVAPTPVPEQNCKVGTIDQATVIDVPAQTWFTVRVESPHGEQIGQIGAIGRAVSIQVGPPGIRQRM